MDRGAWRATVHGSQRVGCDWAASSTATTSLKSACFSLGEGTWFSAARQGVPGAPSPPLVDLL